jgi:GT2 family glycosyltransferase/glycosyltransferase involved in cell wall biosynthesis
MTEDRPPDDALQAELQRTRARVVQLEAIIRQQHAQLAQYHVRLARATFQRDVLEQSRFGRARRAYLRWKNRLLRLLGRPEIDDSYPEADFQAMLPSPLDSLGDAQALVQRMIDGPDGPIFPPINGKPDIVYFSTIEWSHLVQRPQQLMTRFAARRHRIFWLDVLLDEGPPVIPCPQLAPDVYLVRLPGPARLVYALDLEGRALDEMALAFDRIRCAYAMDSAVCFVNFPGWAPLAFRLRERFGWPVVYDCLDDQPAFRALHRFHTADREPDLIRSCDLLTVTSQVLYDRMAPLNPATRLIRNGADYARFSQPATVRPLDLPDPDQGPLVGFYGSLAEWVDYDLLESAARQRPDWRFVFVGPELTPRFAALRSLPNVQHVPQLARFDDLPGYLARFDVCMLPFRDIPVTRAADPVKVYEYLAAGKPVVAAPLPEMLPLAEAGVLAVYESPAAFVPLLEQAIRTPAAPQVIARRQQLAAQNTWDHRCDAFEDAFAALYPMVTLIVVTWNNPLHTRLCLESLLARTRWPRYRIVVVDNGSDEALTDYLKDMEAAHPRITAIFNGENLGFARANNIALRRYEAESDYFALLNDDTLVATGWLPRLMRHVRQPGVGLVGPVTNWAGNEARIPVGYADVSDMNAWALSHMRTHDGEAFDIPTLNGFCVLFSRETLARVGLLDERFTIGMFEDDDFSRRVRAAGLRVRCCRDAFVHHFGRASFGRLEDAEYRRLFESHRALYEAKWGERWKPPRTPT